MQLAPAILAALLIVAAIAAIWDLRTRRIPNWLVLAGLVAGFGLNGFLYGLPGLATAAIGMLTGFGIYLLLHLLRAMGAGDVKFMAAVGSLVGWRDWFHIFFAAVIVGAIAGLIMAFAKGRLGRTLNNVGYIIWEIGHFRPPHVRREDLDVKSEKALRLPHGASIAAGIFILAGWGWWIARAS